MKVILLLFSTVILYGVTSAKPVAEEKDKLLDALLALQQEDNDDGLAKSVADEQDEEQEFERVLEQEDDNGAALIQKLHKLKKMEAEIQILHHTMKWLVRHFWLNDN